MNVPQIGHCGLTKDDACDCANGASGSWPLASIKAQKIEDCVAHCLARCPRCNFVSFSAHKTHRECSWYTECPRVQWAFQGTSYLTLQVRNTSHKLLPPPPPPAQAMPEGAAPGYCALMGPTFGHCDRSDQGSWRNVKSAAGCIQRCASCARCRYVSSVTEEPYPRGRISGGPHAPYWWSCRWFSRCDLADLRRSPPGGAGYVSVQAQSGPAHGSTSVVPPSRGHTTTESNSGVHLAIVTVAARPPRKGLRGGYEVGCALVQWCQNARRLQSILPKSWMVDRLVLGATV